MSLKPKLGVDWRRTVEIVRKMLLLPQVEAPRKRFIHVREPRHAEIEQWLRSQK